MTAPEPQHQLSIEHLMSADGGTPHAPDVHETRVVSGQVALQLLRRLHRLRNRRHTFFARTLGPSETMLEDRSGVAINMQRWLGPMKSSLG